MNNADRHDEAERERQRQERQTENTEHKSKDDPHSINNDASLPHEGVDHEGHPHREEKEAEQKYQHNSDDESTNDQYKKQYESKDSSEALADSCARIGNRHGVDSPTRVSRMMASPGKEYVNKSIREDEIQQAAQHKDDAGQGRDERQRNSEYNQENKKEGTCGINEEEVPHLIASANSNNECKSNHGECCCNPFADTQKNCFSGKRN